MPSPCLRRPISWAAGECLGGCRKTHIERDLFQSTQGLCLAWGGPREESLLACPQDCPSGGVAEDCSREECPLAGCLEPVTWELGFEGCLGVHLVAEPWGGLCKINDQSVQGCWWATAGRCQCLCICAGTPPHLLLPECCDYGSVTTLDWVLVTDRAHLNLSLSASPSAEPGKTKDTGYMWAE